MTILDDIVEYKRSEELPRRKQRMSLEAVRDRAAESPPPRDFVASLRRGSNVAVIAELKKASPSKGILCPDFDPRGLLEIYVENGASAISVLTDEKYFQGRLGYLVQVKVVYSGLSIVFGMKFFGFAGFKQLGYITLGVIQVTELYRLTGT